MFTTPGKPSSAGSYIPFINSNMVADWQNSLPAAGGSRNTVFLPDMKKTVKPNSMLPEQLLAWQDEVQENASSHTGCWTAFTQPAPTLSEIALRFPDMPASERQELLDLALCEFQSYQQSLWRMIRKSIDIDGPLASLDEKHIRSCLLYTSPSPRDS